MKAYLDVLLENLLVLLLLVEHMLLLGLLQGSLIHLPPVHLLQLLTLLQRKQVIQAGCSQALPVWPRQQMQICPQGLRGGKSPKRRAVSLMSNRPRYVGICVPSTFTFRANEWKTSKGGPWSRGKCPL